MALGFQMKKNQKTPNIRMIRNAITNIATATIIQIRSTADSDGFRSGSPVSFFGWSWEIAK